MSIRRSLTRLRHLPRVCYRPEWLSLTVDNLARIATGHWNPGIPLQAGENLAPFFIIGSGRCGTTLLRRILQANTDIHIPPELCMLPRMIRMFRRENYASWDHLVRLSLDIMETSPDFSTFEISLHDLHRSLLAVPEEERSLACILDQFYRYHAESVGSGCRIWGDKTPGNTFRIGRLHSVFPRLRAIHVLRDGVDVVGSFIKAGLYEGIEPAALRWTSAVRVARAFGAQHPEQFMEIRYEDLVRVPETTTRAVCQFLDIRYDPQMISAIDHVAAMGDVGRLSHHNEVALPIRTASIGKGTRSFSPSDLARLEWLIGDALAACGYPRSQPSSNKKLT